SARAGQIAIGHALKQGVKGGVRATVGATGIVNSAHLSESDLGHHVQIARGMYFVGDATLGLAQGGWRMMSRMRGVEAAADGARALQSQIDLSRWARLHRYSETGARLTELPFGYMILRDIGQQ